jgi:hypothetical protein
MSRDEVQGRRSHPVLGPTLTVFAALLWAYVVFGTFTTSWMAGSAPLGEGVAVLLVAVATVAAWAHAVRSSLSVAVKGPGGLVRRSAAVGLLAFAMWGLLVILATLVAVAIPPARVDAIVMAGLLVVAALGARAGHRLTRAAPPRTVHALSFPVVAFWMCIAAITLAACVEIVGER